MQFLVKFDNWSIFLTSGQKTTDPPESVYGEMISIDGQTQLLVKFDYWSNSF